MKIELTPEEQATANRRRNLARARLKWQTELERKPKELGRLASSPALSKQERKNVLKLRKLAKDQLRENRWLASRTRTPTR